MKSPYVSELQPSQVITTTFLVQHKDIRQKKSGEPYLSLQLGDRTGEIDAKMWDNVAEVADTFERDDYVRVRGLVQLYQNKPQLTVHKLARVDAGEVDPADFIPASSRDPDEMFEELRGVIASIANPHLKALLDAVFSGEEIARRFRSAPAAKMIHHAWLGGLLEHVLSLCKLCRLVGPHYPGVDVDLLLTGAILHDIGKVYELSYERSFGYTDEGQLIGHIVIGTEIVGEKLRGLPDFPPRLRQLVLHMLLSHHGELEFGSPKVPLFPEALLLHMLDNMDSKLETMRAQQERDRLTDSSWTGMNFALDRCVLKKQRYLDGEAPAPDPPAPPASASPAPPASSAPLPPRVAPQRPPRPSPSASVLGDKLREALKGE